MAHTKKQQTSANQKLKNFGIRIRQIENGWLVEVDDDNFNTKIWFAKDKTELRELVSKKTNV